MFHFSLLNQLKKKLKTVFNEAYVISHHAYMRYCVRFNQSNEDYEIMDEIQKQIKKGTIEKQTKTFRYISFEDKVFICLKAENKWLVTTVLTDNMIF